MRKQRDRQSFPVKHLYDFRMPQWCPTNYSNESTYLRVGIGPAIPLCVRPMRREGEAMTFHVKRGGEVLGSFADYRAAIWYILQIFSGSYGAAVAAGYSITEAEG